MQRLKLEKHKTLICTSFYTPEKGAAPHRVTTMSENLSGSVTVITPLPNYPTGRIFKNQLKWIFKKEKEPNTSLQNHSTVTDLARLRG